MQTITGTGGNLFQLACVFLGDASQWVRIAALNSRVDPWLDGVWTLQLPPIDPAAGGGIGQQ